jgi:aminoglycoside phosphotransferase
MNKAFDLFDADRMAEIFRKKILPLYPQYRKIVAVSVKPYKKLIWETTYQVVVDYRVSFADDAGQTAKIEIVCSAHSEEPRENAFKVLQYLWQTGFPNVDRHIPRPLFYDQDYRGLFYEAISGENLLYYIKEGNKEVLSEMVLGAAALFAQLHQTPVTDTVIASQIFNRDNERIRTVVPGQKKILEIVGVRFPKYYPIISEHYQRLSDQEEDFFKNNSQRWLIHGDAHPENIIRTVDGGIGLIDFNDMCLADFTRDLGAFVQQLEYKLKIKANAAELVPPSTKLFLDHYFSLSASPRDEAVEQRIKFYHDFTSLRTAVYFLTSHQPNTDRVDYLLSELE